MGELDCRAVLKDAQSFLKTVISVTFSSSTSVYEPPSEPTSTLSQLVRAPPPAARGKSTRRDAAQSERQKPFQYLHVY